MTKNNKVLEVIFGAVDEINGQRETADRLEKSPNTVLFGGDGKLDSLGLVDLIVATEQRVEEAFGVTLTLADEKAMSRKNSPFRTITTLAEYVSDLLSEESHAV